jgi:hypothetical protein
MRADGIVLFDILGDGTTTWHQGGLNIQAGGMNIQHGGWLLPMAPGTPGPAPCPRPLALPSHPPPPGPPPLAPGPALPLLPLPSLAIGFACPVLRCAVLSPHPVLHLFVAPGLTVVSGGVVAGNDIADGTGLRLQSTIGGGYTGEWDGAALGDVATPPPPPPPPPPSPYPPFSSPPPSNIPQSFVKHLVIIAWPFAPSVTPLHSPPTTLADPPTPPVVLD